MRISDWSSDVCSSDLARLATPPRLRLGDRRMQFRRPSVAHFPDALLTGYRRFRETGWKHERERWTDLAEGQSPRVMVIACSDSRADPATIFDTAPGARSEEHTSELQSLMRNSYAVFCLKQKKQHNTSK